MKSANQSLIAPTLACAFSPAASFSQRPLMWSPGSPLGHWNTKGAQRYVKPNRKLHDATVKTLHRSNLSQCLTTFSTWSNFTNSGGPLGTYEDLLRFWSPPTRFDLRVSVPHIPANQSTGQYYFSSSWISAVALVTGLVSAPASLLNPISPWRTSVPNVSLRTGNWRYWCRDSTNSTLKITKGWFNGDKQ